MTPRLVRMLVVAAACCLASVLGTGAARAQGGTHTISFTGSGPSPVSLSIRDGDRVEFRNEIDAGAAVPVLGPATGALSSVSVTVSGATANRFTLERGKSVTVGPYHSGTKELVAHYTSTYSSKLVLGALPGPSKETAGTVTVAAPSAGAARNSPGPRGGGHQAAGPVPTRSEGTGSPPGAPAGQSAGASDPGPATMPTLHYTPQAPNVAAQVVPHGDGGRFRSGAPRRTPAPPVDRTAAGSSPADAGIPPESDEDPVHPAAASSAVPELPFGLDWAAVCAVLLLCVVVGVLIRTLVVRRLLSGGSRTPDS